MILDQGAEVFKSITEFADRENTTGASVSAIGALSPAKVGWFDFAAKTYKPIEINQQCEGLSVLGDVAQGDDGNASLHLHAVLGLQDGTLRRGHLLSGSVQPTLEVTITESVLHLHPALIEGLSQMFQSQTRKAASSCRPAITSDRSTNGRTRVG
ncbi:putative DNA-binding protein with PD1-like motif [Bradyrhizobium sp. USDA 3311]|uniref:PPC domain-containing DNA-binding protein n=1 Tax=Bradyrhizobium sp. LCT2 TaxID=2493093 RepID=UPI001373C87F|nr:DUF296 domain-containing protein [Bradyrhizobium sp. LCT2]QHP72993.1 DUF296 domain-containing protein [Bradyrhizobium sp. LCT2]